MWLSKIHQKWTTLSFPPLPSPLPPPFLPPLPPIPFPPFPLRRVYEKFSKVNMQDENSNSQLERREKIHQHVNILNDLIRWSDINFVILREDVKKRQIVNFDDLFCLEESSVEFLMRHI